MHSPIIAMHGSFFSMVYPQTHGSTTWQLWRHFSSGRESVLAPRCLTRCMLPHYKLARKSKEAQRGSTFPFVDSFEVGKGRFLNSEQVAELLTPLMGEERLERFDRVVANRTFNVLPIVEGIHDMGNLAAVFRSADALGFGAVHCIRGTKYKQSKRASGGAEKWLDVQLWDDTRECLTAVREIGYQIVATHLSADAVDISAVDWTRPTAVVLGNEKEGVSEATLALADAHVVVPMVGFVESFNISVAAALILYQARMARLQTLGYHGDLNEEERRILRSLLLLRNKGQTNEMVTHLLNRPPPDWQIHHGHGDWGGKFPTPPVPSDTKCHYWDGEQCYGEALVFPGKKCTHSGGHRPGVVTLNKQKLRLMCEAKGLPLPAVLMDAPRGSAAAACSSAERSADAAAAMGQEHPGGTAGGIGGENVGGQQFVGSLGQQEDQASGGADGPGQHIVTASEQQREGLRELAAF